MKNLFLVMLLSAATALSAQTKYNVEGKPEFSFTEVRPYDKINDLLSLEEVNGFRFDPIRNKSVVELHFTIPNIKQYEFVFVDRGDTARGFTSCLIINLAQENITDQSFVKIDKYPLPFAERPHYRVRAVTKDGTIRYYPYIIELREGDLQSREQQRLAFEARLQEQKERNDRLLKEWEVNINKSNDESWRNLKPEVVSGGRLVDPSEPVADGEGNSTKSDMEKKLDKIKKIEVELNAKIDELKKIIESLSARQ